MPQRAIPPIPRTPKVQPVGKYPQLESPEKVARPKRYDLGDMPLGDRPKIDRSLRGQPGGPFISPYMNNLKRDPSRQKREDTEQRDKLKDLYEMKREIDDKIRKIINEETRINPYNVNRLASETSDQMISDLRNMGQAPWSGNLSGFYAASPLHRLFKNQFGIAEEVEDDQI